LSPGDAYIEDATAARAGHLRVVIAVTSDGQAVTVGCTTHRPPCDESCILEPGDHPFIRHKSVLDFRVTTVETADSILAMVESGTWTPQQRVSPSVLQRMIDGALASPRTKDAFKTTLRIATGQTVIAKRRRLGPRRG
jgi:hypothetical protein